eukprot:g12879.t1
MSLTTKIAAPLFAIALLLSLTTLTQAENALPTNEDGFTLDEVSLGEHVMGPKLEADDLKGKVVVFEYWGDRCPPCHASIPSIVKLRSEYTADKLQIVANQVWTRNNTKEVTKEVWEKHGGDDTVTVVNYGKLKKADHRGVPHAYVFGHDGEFLWKGNPHPRAGGPEMKKVVKEAIAAMPEQG